MIAPRHVKASDFVELSAKRAVSNKSSGDPWIAETISRAVGSREAGGDSQIPTHRTPETPSRRFSYARDNMAAARRPVQGKARVPATGRVQALAPASAAPIRNGVPARNGTGGDALSSRAFTGGGAARGAGGCSGGAGAVASAC